MNPRLSIIAGLGMSLLATPALAQGHLGTTSSGTVGITVEIPPLGSAVAAAHQGAVGLWSITNSTDGLMVKLPASINTTADASGTTATVFGNRHVVFEAAMVKNPFVELTEAETTDARGLSRHAFKLSLTHTNLTPTVNTNATILIIGV